MTEEEIKVLQDEVARLRQEKTAMSQELAASDSRVAAAEEMVNARDSELAGMRHELGAVKEHFNKLNGEYSKAVAGYRSLTVTANPEIPVEMITGDDIGAIEKAVAGAKALIGKVREQLEKDREQVRVPTGSPPRTPPDLSGLSPREKINAGISRVQGLK
jgi:chromosome segregation ATPase